jgi:hypothetical protein
VTDLSEDNRDLLVSMGFVSNMHFGIQILPFSPPPSNYVSSIRGLTWRKKTDASVVEDLIRSTLESNTTTKRFITNFVNTKNDCIPEDTIRRGLGVEWIVASVHAYLHVMGDEDSHSAEFL